MNKPLLAVLGWTFLCCLAFGAAVAAQEQKPSPQPKKVKVFILAGQSNMEGKARLSLLERQIEAPPTKKLFEHLHQDGKWVVRDDVWINFLKRRGNLTVGFGSRNCFGPELEFGNVVGDHFKEPVLLIKAAWGGKSLGRDFRPPSSGLPPKATLQKIVDKTNAQRKKQDSRRKRKRSRPPVTMDQVKESYGHFYRAMLREVRVTLAELDKRFPDYQGQGYEICGLVWFQGWNDLFDPYFFDNYGQNLQNLIRDVRKELKTPKLPVVIGVMGQNGLKPAKPGSSMEKIQQAQSAIQKLPEFQGNVRSVRTDAFWDKAAAKVFPTWRKNKEAWDKVGSDRPYHYLGSAITFARIGRGFGEAMLELLGEADPDKK